MISTVIVLGLLCLLCCFVGIPLVVCWYCNTCCCKGHGRGASAKTETEPGEALPDTEFNTEAGGTKRKKRKAHRRSTRRKHDEEDGHSTEESYESSYEESYDEDEEKVEDY